MATDFSQRSACVGWKLTLAVLEKIMLKHGVSLPPECIDFVKERYAVPVDIGEKVYKELIKGGAIQTIKTAFDEKVFDNRFKARPAPTSKLRQSMQKSLKEGHSQAGKGLTAIPRKGSREMWRTTAYMPEPSDDASELNTDASNTILDAYKLCDDMYMCTWVSQ